jgi:YVTN family beta-propeller protein
MREDSRILARGRPVHVAERAVRVAALSLAMAFATTWMVGNGAALADPQPAAPPLPFGSAVTPDLLRLFVVHTAEGRVSVVDTDPASPAFLREIEEIAVGHRPLGIAAGPDGADVFVVNSGDDSISIIDVASLTVRKTLTSPLLQQPCDIAIGPTELPLGPAFSSGTFHAYISNAAGADVAIYESGPAGPAGLGFDDIVGAVNSADGNTAAGPATRIVDARGVVFDPAEPLDGFTKTVGCVVAHRDADGHGVATHVSYVQDRSPGPDLVDTTTTAPGLQGKVFRITAQFVSTHVGAGLDVALADEHLSVSHPTRVYLSMSGGVIDVFDLATGEFLERHELGFDVPDLGVFLQP